MINQIINDTKVALQQVKDFAVNHPREFTCVIAANLAPMIATYCMFRDAEPGWYTFGKCEVVCASLEALAGGYPACCIILCNSLSANRTVFSESLNYSRLNFVLHLPLDQSANHSHGIW